MRIDNLFSVYILHPFSRELNASEKVIALVTSIALGIFTLGIAHLVSYGLLRRRITHFISNSPTVNHQLAKTIKKTELVFSSIIRGTSPFSKEWTEGCIEELIQSSYAKPLPKREEVQVMDPNTSQYVLWKDLSREKKIALYNHYSLDHDKMGEDACEWYVDACFYGGLSSTEYLARDPREGHGCDHASRAAIIAASFAYLYKKYHPEGASLDVQDISLLQIIASGHDAARQTDGPDLFDEESAARTVEFLKGKGFDDESLTRLVPSSIAKKDADPLDERNPKSLLAQIVQSADCAEFARGLLIEPCQDPDGFERSLRYLDIFRVFEKLAGGQKDVVLNEETGLTYGDFLDELTLLRKEINLFIYSTHNREMRTLFSEPNGSYYKRVLNEVTSYQYPALFSALEAVGIKEKTVYVPKPTTNHSYRWLRQSGAAEIALKERQKDIFAAIEADDWDRVDQLACLSCELTDDHPLFDVKALLGDADETVLPLGGEFVRRQYVRVCRKQVRGENFFEVSLEIPSKYRPLLEKFLERRFPQRMQVPTAYEFNDQRQTIELIGSCFDWQIALSSGVEARIGKDRGFWAEYSHIRLRFDEKINPNLLSVMSELGLPACLCRPTDEELSNEAAARSIALRFPQRVYDYAIRNIPKPDPREVYSSLSPEEQAVVDRDVRSSDLLLAGDHFEVVNQDLGDEVKAKGVRAFGTFINAPSLEETAKTLSKIFQKGLLSARERFERGIFGVGTAPNLNFRTGSASQVFTRILSEKMFTGETPFSSFVLQGSAFILMDPSLFERTPYSYPYDSIGMRSPDFWTPFYSCGVGLEFNLHGSRRLLARLPFEQLLQTLNEGNSPLNETMFDRTIPPQYIRNIVVYTHQERAKLIELLEKEGVTEINGVILSEAIMVADHLNPAMLEAL